MVKLVASTIIDAPIEAVWAVVRDFNGEARWQGSAEATLERGAPADKVGAVRRFRLGAGEPLREQLLALDEVEMTMSTCLLDTPVPLFNFVAHTRLLPVTDGDMTFWHWEMAFDTPAGRERELSAMVANNLQTAGMDAVRRQVGERAA